MPGPDYRFCNNDLEVHAGDRTSYRTAGWWSTNLASEGMCNWSVCGSGDVSEWFAAATKYISGPFMQDYKDYNDQILVRQGAPDAQQSQILGEAETLLKGWNNYRKYFLNGGGGPVGASFKTGGYAWGDPSDPDLPTLMNGDVALELSREIVDYFDAAACLRDKFNESRPEGMLEKAPGYGSVTTRPQSETSSEGIGTMGMIGIGVGLWIALKALSE